MFRFILVFMLLGLPIYSMATVVVHKATGEYATIDAKKTNDIIQVLLKKDRTQSASALAAKIEKNIGTYNPGVIVALGVYYMMQRDFDKAALYLRFGMLRAAIDVKASHDKSLGDVGHGLYKWVWDGAREMKMVPDEKGQFEHALSAVAPKIIPMVKKTPRNYEIRWASIHSAGAFTNAPMNYAKDAELKKIIEAEYKSFAESNPALSTS